MKALDGGFFDGGFRADGDADKAQEIDGDGADDAEGRMAKADHFLVFSREGGEGGLEEEAVGGDRGFGERGIFDKSDDLPGFVSDGELGAVAFDLGEEFGFGPGGLGEAEGDDRF